MIHYDVALPAAAIVGCSGIAASATGIAKLPIFEFPILVVVPFVVGARRGRRQLLGRLKPTRPLTFESEDIHMQKTLPILLSFIVLFTLSACNTVEGVGKDVQKGGESLEKAAKSTKEKM